MNIAEIDPKTKKQIDDADELGSYQIIDYTGGFIWRMNHDYNRGDFTAEQWLGISKDVDNFWSIQMYAVSQLTRFGISKPFVDDAGHPSAEYWAWFRWWDEYFKRTLSEDQWDEFSRKQRNKEDISGYRPEGTWRDRLPEEEESQRQSEEFRKKMQKSTTNTESA